MHLIQKKMIIFLWTKKNNEKDEEVDDKDISKL